MKKITVILLLVLFYSYSFSQEKIKAESFDEPKNNEFGAHAGFTTGVGLSYRHWSEKIGVQITALPVFSKNDGAFISAGLTGMYSINNSKYVRFYAYLGNHIMYYNSHGYTETIYNIGAGPGFSFGKIVSFNVMFGYGVIDVTNNYRSTLVGEIGLYYKF